MAQTLSRNRKGKMQNQDICVILKYNFVLFCMETCRYIEFFDCKNKWIRIAKINMWRRTN